MLPEFDKNAAFIWACYGLGALAILATALQVVFAERAARARLDAADADATRDTGP